MSDLRYLIWCQHHADIVVAVIDENAMLCPECDKPIGVIDRAPQKSVADRPVPWGGAAGAIPFGTIEDSKGWQDMGVVSGGSGGRVLVSYDPGQNSNIGSLFSAVQPSPFTFQGLTSVQLADAIDFARQRGWTE